MSGNILLLIEFKIHGNLRFLSHAETIRLFQRAFVRAGIKAVYSKGFNPRPKLSLPLPRSVGVETDADLLCLQVQAPQPTNDQPESPVCQYDTEKLKARLSAQLPEGCYIITVRATKTKISFHPCSATYILPVQPDYLDENLKMRFAHLLASESLNIERRDTRDPKCKILNTKFKKVDVRPFVKSIELDDKGITIECKITSAGSIRIDEILQLLGLDYTMLAAPIRRTSIQWQEKPKNLKQNT